VAGQTINVQMEIINGNLDIPQNIGIPPIVSVLMTAFNRQHYIANAIQSVLNSTFTDFELIIVDDASTDNTLAVAREYEARDNRIKIYKNDVNLGQFGNRNMAASYANGKYLKYVDSDDFIYPYSLKMMVDALEAFPEAGLAFCLTYGPCKKPLPYLISSEEALQQHFFEGGLLFCGPSGLLFKREVFKSVGMFEDYGMPSDNHLTLKIASRFSVVAINRDLFWWRLHPQQEFSLNIGNDINIFNNYAYTKDIVSKHLLFSDQIKNLIMTNQKKIFFSNIFRLVFKEGKPGTAFTLLSLFVKQKSLNEFCIVYFVPVHISGVISLLYYDV
jgi:glycosyltransferase involved in cell wall biosynthesis